MGSHKYRFSGIVCFGPFLDHDENPSPSVLCRQYWKSAFLQNCLAISSILLVGTSVDKSKGYKNVWLEFYWLNNALLLTRGLGIESKKDIFVERRWLQRLFSYQLSIAWHCNKKRLYLISIMKKLIQEIYSRHCTIKNTLIWYWLWF